MDSKRKRSFSLPITRSKSRRRLGKEVMRSGEKEAGAGKMLDDAISVSRRSESDKDVELVKVIHNLKKMDKKLAKIGQNLEDIEKNVKKVRDNIKAVQENVKEVLNRPVSTITSCDGDRCADGDDVDVTRYCITRGRGLG